jgi:hypothetical protein
MGILSRNYAKLPIYSGINWRIDRMTVGELIKRLREFNENHPVITQDENNDEKSVVDVFWQYDGFCKLILEE